MRPSSVLQMSRTGPVVLLIAVQVLCSGYFVMDIVRELRPLGWAGLGHASNWSEIGATAALFLGLVFEGVVLWRMAQSQQQMQGRLNVASGAMADLMQGHFVSWGLTPTEQDVAAFTIKGFSIPEIAALRGSADGTIKTHLNAIYRKSGVAGRAQLVAVLVEDLFEAPLISGNAPTRPDRRIPADPVGK